MTRKRFDEARGTCDADPLTQDWLKQCSYYLITIIGQLKNTVPV